MAKSSCFKTLFSVDIDDVVTNLQMEIIELQNNDTLKTAFKESDEIKLFYSSLSETDFKKIKSFAKNIYCLWQHLSMRGDILISKISKK